MNENPIFKFAIREDLTDVAENFLPKRGEPFATGWDVCAAQPDRKDLIIRPKEYFKIPLGFRSFIPEGWWFQLYPRSSSFTKKNMHALIGIIDEHYPNEAIFAGQYLPTQFESIYTIEENNLIIKFGDPIGQIIPVKRVEMIVENLSNNEFDELCKNRKAIRQGGFGSTH